MALWVDKYRPTQLSKMDFHRDTTLQLLNLAQNDGLPHLLIYGPSGSGKKTRVVGILNELFGPGVLRIKADSRILMTNSNKKLELNILSSNYHIDLTPSQVGIYDRIVMSELLKEIAQTKQLDIRAKHRFKVVVVNEADSLSRDAQAALRRTMEKNLMNMRLILICNSISKILLPIQSRTLLIRIPAPQEAEIVNALTLVLMQEKIEAAPNLLQRIAAMSNRNARRALLMLEATHAKHPSLEKDVPIVATDWENYIDTMVCSILKEQTPQQILVVRGMLYDLLTHCIPASTILKTTALKLLVRVDPVLQPEIAALAAKYEHRLQLGSKAIFHLEGFVANFMHVLASYLT